MADYDSQLPVRSEADGTDERVLVKVQDGATPGGASATMTVSENKAHVRVHGNDGSSDQELYLSESGKANADGDYDATNNTQPDSTGVIGHDRGASIDETSQNQRVTAVAGDNNKVAMDVALQDSSGNTISESNPLFVVVGDNPADEVDDFDQGVAIAKDAVDNHDYTVSGGKTMKGIEAEGSASGKARFELQVETAAAAGTFNTVMVKFNSTAKPNVEFKYLGDVATGVIVRMARTNLDNQAQDLYSQIRGREV